MRVGGIVLCGGRSTRMGQPKAWLPFGGEFLLQRIVRIVRVVVDPVIVVAAPGQDVPPLPSEVEVARDTIEGKGPLGGLAAGLAALEGKADAAYLSSCDVPFLKAEFVRRAISLLGNAAACVPEVDGVRHPLAAVYRVSILPHIRELLGSDRLRLQGLMDHLPTRIIQEQEFADVDPEFVSLRNVNTLADYEGSLWKLDETRTE